MSPNILFVGADSKGSWLVRGEQIASALGARATLRPVRADWRWADVIVLVKRAIDRWGDEARRTHCPLVWDALDFWTQPDENHLTASECIAQVRKRKAQYGLAAVIGATRAMAKDVGGVYIPHHHRPGLKPTPPRDRVQVVAYEGTPKYLGAWKPTIERACAERGLQFVVNPKSLSDADVVVAFRDGKWDGWPCRQWKSGVKYVNAVVAGRPVVTQFCAASEEIAPRHTTASAPDGFGAALDIVSLPQVRENAYQQALKQRQMYGIESIAKQYRAVVSSVLQVAA
jgi:hypothetical protein